MERLVLEVVRYGGPTGWYWRLREAEGNVLADHEVALDPASDEYQAFERLDDYLADDVDLARPLASEAEIVDRVGRWIGEHVFGPVGRAIVDAADLRPVAVEVRVPPEARELLFRPLELAIVSDHDPDHGHDGHDGQDGHDGEDGQDGQDGQDGSGHDTAGGGDLPLALRDVSLVMVPLPARSGSGSGSAVRPARSGKQPVGAALRMLAVFSLPDGAGALGLREQRRALARRVHAIRARYGKAVDLHVLQYGATRERLQAALEDGDGWDIVQFNGHGYADAFVLERPGGGGDIVGVGDLVGMLRAARGRLKLLELSSCNSAADPRPRPRPRPGAGAGAGTSAISGLPDLSGVAGMQGTPGTPSASGGPGASRPRTPAIRPWPRVLADEAARHLGCAVLAMRYQVEDAFAIALAGHLYERMLGSGQPLARALQLALPRALADTPDAAPLSVGTPALFGAGSVDLTLRPPDGPPPTFATAGQTMARFPPEPDLLVGRSGLLHRAADALRTPGRSGLVLTGPAGIGKTTLALELAYSHEHEFAAHAWYRAQAPRAGEPLAHVVTAFAACLDAQLPGLDLAARTTSAARLHAFLPQLTKLMEQHAVLVVVDADDALLTRDGRWRDPAWAAIVNALLDHGGLSRLILTTRRLPRDLPGSRVHIEKVPPL